ncbi:glycosyl hydrolase family 18 protein [Vibrio sp. S12_S33]|uniref:glycosyl hydrolase family 18 protein n=1 Tax=Vibrio sp. S12_S33 TaxID=2720223 RepID=UPI00177E7BFD|nr:glycosyl hydrolase family 18 protein [Vibrio sp. S12_S33]MBD1566582.1 chitinase [Vibrio sp. S12_S33]
MKAFRFALLPTFISLLITHSVYAYPQNVSKSDGVSVPPDSTTGLTEYALINKYGQYSNEYNKDQNLPKVTAYLSNWTFWEQGYQPNLTELSKYDKILLSFFGLCGTEIGDPTVISGVNGLKSTCETFSLEKFELASTDKDGDFNKPLLPGQNWDEHTWLDPNLNAGMMKVMKDLHETHGTKIGISIFGWSLSNIASDAVKPENREKVIDSIVNFVKAYDFIEHLDIDWEYPGIQGAPRNKFDPVNDATNYKDFISELKSEFNNNGLDISIAIAAGAPKDKIDAAKLNDLIAAGVDMIHLMTYDFFGQWAESLDHHTNLFSSSENKWSADKSIQYMINVLHIDSKKISIGYANYSRNALTKPNAISLGDMDINPLSGNFTPNSRTIGSWETGVTTINDIMSNYVTPSASSPLLGKNGFNLYTDEYADADFLYNDSEGIFISIDTPRTVFAKAQYVKKYNLGGIFNWMADHDEGLMLNAAREGLGYIPKVKVFDMNKIINSCGINIESTNKCHDLTYLDTAVDSITTNGPIEDVYAPGKSYDLGATTTSEEGVTVKSVLWSIYSVKGTNESNINILNPNQLNTSFSINDESANENIDIKFIVSAEFSDDQTANATLDYKLKVGESIPIITKIKHEKEYNISSGDPLSFESIASDDKDKNLIYSWSVNLDSSVIDYGQNSSKLVIDTNKLPNKPQYVLKATSVVKNKFENTDTKTAKTTVIGDESENDSPESSFIINSQDIHQGDIVSLTSTSKDELPDELIYTWKVIYQDEEIQVDNRKGINASFIAENLGKYTIKLTVKDVFGLTASSKQVVDVKQKDIPDICSPVDSDAVNYPEWDPTRDHYNTGDKVSHNGLVFEPNYWTNSEPVYGNSDWSLISPNEQPWSATNAYKQGDEVDHNDRRWRANWWVVGTEPTEGASEWTDIGEAICNF